MKIYLFMDKFDAGTCIRCLGLYVPLYLCLAWMLDKQAQIRHHRMRRLIMACTVCSKFHEFCMKSLVRGHPIAFREEEVLRQFQEEVLVQILNFPIHSIHFHFSLSSR